MSSSNNTLDSEVAAEYQLGIAMDYINMAAGALVLYDAVILSGQEIELVWKRKPSTTTFLLAANRFFGIMFAAGTIMSLLNLPQLSSCMGANIWFMISELMVPMVWAAFSAVRVYAIGNQAWRTATIVFLLALGPFGGNLYFFSQAQFSEEDIQGVICAISPDVTTTTINILEMIERSLLIASDAIVLIVTWRNTYQIRKLANTIDMNVFLATHLLRDGTLFFVAGLVLNVVQLAIFVSFNANGGISISTLVISISCVITSRFFVSLRQGSRCEFNTTLTTPSSIIFESSHNTHGTVSVMAGELDLDAILYSNGYTEEEEERLEEREALEPDVVEPAEEPQPAAVVEV